VKPRPSVWQINLVTHRLPGAGIVGPGGQVVAGPRRSGRRAVSQRLPVRSIPGRIRGLPRGHSPSLSDPTGAHSSHSSTMAATLCKVMYFSAVMKVPSSWGSCTSRTHPHFSHASDIHWAGSELIVIPASSQNPVEQPAPPGEALAVVADAHAQEKGPDRMAGPLRRDKPVLIPMYAEISQRPPPPRPFLNLLRSPVHLPLRCLVRALLGLSTVVVGAFSNTHHRDLSRPHKPH
jgi:hypothetical protein